MNCVFWWWRRIAWPGRSGSSNLRTTWMPCCGQTSSNEKVFDELEFYRPDMVVWDLDWIRLNLWSV
jgi:hypothetical protein